jgi:hypothetical protein
MKRLIISLVFFSLLQSSAYAENNPISEKGFIKGPPIFAVNEDPLREAESWAVCSVAYATLESLSEDGSSEARIFGNLANGAEIAIIVSQVAPLMNEKDLRNNSFNKRFKAAWMMGKVMSESLIETNSNAFALEIEYSLKNGNIKEFMSRLNATMDICNLNKDTQQRYIDLWRVLFKEGFFKSSLH